MYQRCILKLSVVQMFAVCRVARAFLLHIRAVRVDVRCNRAGHEGVHGLKCLALLLMSATYLMLFQPVVGVDTTDEVGSFHQLHIRWI